MTTMEQVRQRHIILMQDTMATIAHIIQRVSQADATTYRDGADGWTVLEVLCHLRDYDVIFRERTQLMLEREGALLPAPDHEAMVIEKRYNQQDLAQVLVELQGSRQQSVAFFEGLTAVQWNRFGHHPERGHFTVTDQLMLYGTHDVLHLEQITRILLQA